MAARWERWVNTPQQARARATFERVLETGAVVLAESGYEGFSIARVCQRAGVAPGTLYGRVDGKDLLFLALHDRELERIGTAAHDHLADDGRWSAASGAALVDDVVDYLARHFFDERALVRVFILRAAVDPRVRAEGAQGRHQLEADVAARLMQRAGDYPHPDPADAVRAVSRILLDAFSWEIAFGADPRPAPYDDLVPRLRDLARTYLLTPPAG